MQFMTENLPSSRQSGEHLNNLPLFLGDQDVSYQLYGLVSLWAAALAKADRLICLHKQIIRSLEKHSTYEKKDKKQWDSHNSLHTDTEHNTQTQPAV